MAKTLHKLMAEKHVKSLGELESEALDYKVFGRVEEWTILTQCLL